MNPPGHGDQGAEGMDCVPSAFLTALPPASTDDCRSPSPRPQPWHDAGMIRTTRSALIATLALMVGATVQAAQPTLELVMSDPLWIGAKPEKAYWADDSQSLLYSRQVAHCQEKTLHQLWPSDGLERLVPDDEVGSVDARGGVFTLDGGRKAWSRGGDLFVKDLASGRRSQLTRTAESESSPQWLLDGRLAYQRGGRFLARDLGSGLEEELAELRFEQEPGEPKDEDFLTKQNRRLLGHLQDRRDTRDDRRLRRGEQRAADPTRSPAPWFLGKENERRGAALSPTGRHLLVTVAKKKRDEGRRDRMPVWVTEDGYVGERRVRAKVGTRERAADRLVLLDLAAGTRMEVELDDLPGRRDDPLRELREAKKAREGGDEGEDRPPREKAKRKGVTEETKPRSVNVRSVSWAPDGSRALVQLRANDNKDRWFVAIEARSGSVTPVDRLHDPAWINWRFSEAGWLPDARRLWFLSERSGWSQLSLHDLDTGQTRALTSGRQVVSRVHATRDGSRLLFCATPHHPSIREVFAVDVASGKVEQLSRLGGMNTFVLSPDERQLLIVHSEATRPPELWLQDAVEDATPRPLTDSRSETFRSIDWTAPRQVAIESSHGAGRIHSRLYLPDGPAPTGGWPAVMFIHGSGYLQNAHQGWSQYDREFMFHSLLVDRGFVVLDMDWRGSAGYGRDWRTAIYRNMGGPELEDLRDGVDWLVANAGVDRESIGCYGGSYGGCLTFMALFREPDLFAAGAALRPVTDWAHYNHGYTSNVLNTPELDPEAYRRSSPIEHAAGLSKPLLICAPMLDNNVLFLDTVRLVQRLIELGKTEFFETAIYPVESHGFKNPSSWLDEYSRILALFETHLR